MAFCEIIVAFSSSGTYPSTLPTLVIDICIAGRARKSVPIQVFEATSYFLRIQNFRKRSLIRISEGGDRGSKGLCSIFGDSNWGFLHSSWRFWRKSDGFWNLRFLEFEDFFWNFTDSSQFLSLNPRPSSLNSLQVPKYCAAYPTRRA